MQLKQTFQDMGYIVKKREAKRPCYYALYFLCSLAEILISSGIVYGWASLIIILKKEGYYANRCQKPTAIPLWKPSQVPYYPEKDRLNLTRRIPLVTSNGYFTNCSGQRKLLNLVFNTALSCLCASKFPIGIFVDKCGPRAAQAVGM